MIGSDAAAVAGEKRQRGICRLTPGMGGDEHDERGGHAEGDAARFLEAQRSLNGQYCSRASPLLLRSHRRAIGRRLAGIELTSNARLETLGANFDMVRAWFERELLQLPSKSFTTPAK